MIRPAGSSRGPLALAARGPLASLALPWPCVCRARTPAKGGAVSFRMGRTSGKTSDAGLATSRLKHSSPSPLEAIPHHQKQSWPFLTTKKKTFLAFDSYACRGQGPGASPFGADCAAGGVRVASRSIPPQCGPVRFSLALRTYAPWGVHVVSLTKSRKIPARNILLLLFVGRGRIRLTRRTRRRSRRRRAWCTEYGTRNGAFKKGLVVVMSILLGGPVQQRTCDAPLGSYMW